MSSLADNEIMIAQEHRILLREYGRAQARCSVQLAEQAQRIARLEAQLMQAQAQIVLRDTRLMLAREELAAVLDAAPGLLKRVRLARKVEWLSERVQDLMRELLRLQWTPPSAALPSVREKAVLYVGPDRQAGQTPGPSVAQQAIERAGGRFLHHAGASEDSDGAAAFEQLEASLVAADLVICQTGCVSHDAYWRVHDHCRRTGKQCVLVDQPQAMHFVRKGQLLPS